MHPLRLPKYNLPAMPIPANKRFTPYALYTAIKIPSLRRPPKTNGHMLLNASQGREISALNTVEIQTRAW